MIHIHPYNLGSKSAMALKGYLNDAGIKTIVSHRLRTIRKRLIVGWGSKPYEFDLGRNVPLNHPNQTRILACKKRFFTHVRDNRPDNICLIPSFSDSVDDASGWKETVVARATTSGSGGDGITIHAPDDPLPVVPLYVKYEKKTHEYRVHAFRTAEGWSLDHFQRKVFVKTEERPAPLNWQIRNHTQGFIFQTEEGIPNRVREVSMGVLDYFPDLDFVALDVIYHKPKDKAFVLEGNTAPGLEGPRLQVYCDYILKAYKEKM